MAVKRDMESATYLFLREARADAHDVYDVPLHHAHICQVSAAQRVELLPLPLPLFLLLRQALMTKPRRQRRGAHRSVSIP